MTDSKAQSEEHLHEDRDVRAEKGAKGLIDQVTAIVQSDDSELPQSVKEIFKGNTSR